ncbi:hypothetical protein PTKIN_Ptkin05aG0021000 [Pterospermum kingtungense]
MSDFIPQEIILLILYRLPVKSLVKFTLVCKSWQSLITTSCFIDTHLAKTLSKPISSQPILIRRFTDSPKKEHYFLHLNHVSLDIFQTLKSPLKPRKNLYPRIVGTVHGLICLSDDIFGYTYRIVVWNPSLRRSIELPRPNITFDEVGPYNFTLGFGFDAKKNDYKVVRLVYVQSGDDRFHLLPPKVEVFSVAEKGWRMISGKGIECCFVEASWTQCFLNGRVHWIAYEKKMGGVKNWVLLFDMEDEKFRKMKLPESVVDVNPMKLFISVSSGKLTVFEYYGDAKNRFCNIWVRTEYGDVKSWSKLYGIDNDVLGGGGRVYGLTENGEVFLANSEGGGGLQSPEAFRSLFEVRRGELLLYDPRSRQSKVVQPQGVVDAFVVGDYTESLVLLNKESGATSYEGVKIEEKRESVNPESGEGTSNLVLEEDRSIISRNDAHEEEEDDNSPAFNDLVFQKMVNYSYQMMKFLNQA